MLYGLGIKWNVESSIGFFKIFGGYDKVKCCFIFLRGSFIKLVILVWLVKWSRFM